MLSVLLLGAAVVWAGYAVYIKRQESKALEAFSALAQADVIEMRVVREAKVLSDDPVEVLREAPEADKTAYVAALEKVRAEHKGTTAGHIAALRLGRWYVTGKDFEKAEALYKELLSEIRGAEGEIFASMASEALGVIYENQSRWDDALKVYDASLANEQAALRPLLMLSKARVLTAQKKTEEAKAVYDGVVQSYPNTSYSQQARALSVKAAL